MVKSVIWYVLLWRLFYLKAKKEDPLTQKKVRAVNEETIVAWDVGKDAFRSFRVENVVSFS